MFFWSYQSLHIRKNDENLMSNWRITTPAAHLFTMFNESFPQNIDDRDRGACAFLGEVLLSGNFLDVLPIASVVTPWQKCFLKSFSSLQLASFLLAWVGNKVGWGLWKSFHHWHFGEVVPCTYFVQVVPHCAFRITVDLQKSLYRLKGWCAMYIYMYI